MTKCTSISPIAIFLGANPALSLYRRDADVKPMRDFWVKRRKSRGPKARDHLAGSLF